MLVLTRKKNESIVINDVIKVTVVEIRGDKVRLGIEAPRTIDVHRQEVYDQIHGKRDDAPHEEHASVPPDGTSST
jgi:carbon storage regulator